MGEMTPGQRSSRYKPVGSISADGKRKKVKEGVWADISDGKQHKGEEGSEESNHRNMLSDDQNKSLDKMHEMVESSKNPEKERVHNLVEDYGKELAKNSTKESKKSKVIHEDDDHKVMNMEDHKADTPDRHKKYDEEAEDNDTHTSNESDFNYRIGQDHEVLHIIDKKTNKVVGHMAINDDNQVKSVHIDDDVQGQGLGTKLYEAALKYTDGLTSDDAQEPGDIAIWNKLQNRDDLNIENNEDGTVTASIKNDKTSSKKDKLQTKLKNAINHPETFEDAKPSSYKSSSKSNMVANTSFGMASKGVQQELNDALSNAEKLIDKMGFKFKTPINFFSGNLEDTGMSYNGRFTKNTEDRDETPAIELASTNNVSKTLMHEIGHAIDNAWEHDVEEYRSNTYGDAEIDQHFDIISDMVKSTSFYQDAVKDDADYFLDTAEVFARGFELYSYFIAKDMVKDGQMDSKFLDKFFPDISYETFTVASQDTIFEAHASMRESAERLPKDKRDKALLDIDASEDKSIKAGKLFIGNNNESLLRDTITKSMDFILKHEVVSKAMDLILEYKRSI